MVTQASKIYKAALICLNFLNFGVWAFDSSQRVLDLGLVHFSTMYNSLVRCNV